MATTVTLDDGLGNSITLPAPSPPGKEYATYPMLTSIMWGGGIKVVDLGDGTSWDEPEIFWDLLPTADYNTLRTFIITTVNRSQTAFTYTDENSVEHTNVHYMEGLDEFQKVDFDLWSGTIKLHKDMAA